MILDRLSGTSYSKRVHNSNMSSIFNDLKRGVPLITLQFASIDERISPIDANVRIRLLRFYELNVEPPSQTLRSAVHWTQLLLLLQYHLRQHVMNLCMYIWGNEFQTHLHPINNERESAIAVSGAEFMLSTFKVSIPSLNRNGTHTLSTFDPINKLSEIMTLSNE